MTSTPDPTDAELVAKWAWASSRSGIAADRIDSMKQAGSALADRLAARGEESDDRKSLDFLFSLCERLTDAVDRDVLDAGGESPLSVLHELGPLVDLWRKGQPTMPPPTKAERDNEALRRTVQMCADTFREYEQTHREKGTPWGNHKADRNALIARACERSLSTSDTPSTSAFSDPWPDKAAWLSQLAEGFFLPAGVSQSNRTVARLQACAEALRGGGSPGAAGREARLEAAIRWALGEGDSDFGDHKPERVEGKVYPQYWWRYELRERAGIAWAHEAEDARS